MKWSHIFNAMRMQVARPIIKYWSDCFTHTRWPGQHISSLSKGASWPSSCRTPCSILSLSASGFGYVWINRSHNNCVYLNLCLASCPDQRVLENGYWSQSWWARTKLHVKLKQMNSQKWIRNSNLQSPWRWRMWRS